MVSKKIGCLFLALALLLGALPPATLTVSAVPLGASIAGIVEKPLQSEYWDEEQYLGYNEGTYAKLDSSYFLWDSASQSLSQQLLRDNNITLDVSVISGERMDIRAFFDTFGGNVNVVVMANDYDISDYSVKPFEVSIALAQNGIPSNARTTLRGYACGYKIIPAYADDDRIYAGRDEKVLAAEDIPEIAVRYDQIDFHIALTKNQLYSADILTGPQTETDRYYKDKFPQLEEIYTLQTETMQNSRISIGSDKFAYVYDASSGTPVFIGYVSAYGSSVAGGSSGFSGGGGPSEEAPTELPFSTKYYVAAEKMDQPVSPYLQVTYDANGATSGTVPADTTAYFPNDTVTVKGNEGNLQRDGYVFSGWASYRQPRQNAIGALYLEGGGYRLGRENLTLYAQWTNITGIANNPMVCSSIGDPSNVIVQAGDELLFALDESYFTWVGSPQPLTKELLINNYISARFSPLSQKGVCNQDGIIEKDGKLYYSLRFQGQTAPVPFDITVSLESRVGTYDSTGRQYTGFSGASTPLQGVVNPKVIPVYQSTGFADITCGESVQAQEDISSITLAIGNGVSVMTPLSSGEYYRAWCVSGIKEQDEDIITRYPEIDEVLYLYYGENQQQKATNVIISKDATYYVYDRSLTFLGMVGNRIPVRDVYFLALKKLGGGSAVPSGSSGSGSGGGGGGSPGASTPTTPSNAPTDVSVSAAKIEGQQAASNAKAAGAATATVRIKNPGNISLAAWRSMVEAAGMPVRFYADSMTEDGKAVDVRISLDPAKAAKDLNLAASTVSTRASSVRTTFEKWFSNKVQVISFEQKGNFGQSVEISAKLESGLDAKNLVLYAYYLDTGTGQWVYRQIPNPACWVDENGYIHFTTEYAGDIIISQGTLTRR